MPPDFDVDIDAAILAWENRTFDGTWANHGVAVPDRPKRLVRDRDGEIEVPVMRSLMWRELYEQQKDETRRLQDRVQVLKENLAADA